MDLLLNFLTYAGIGFVMLFVGFLLFEVTTKTKEFKLIAEGNEASAMVIGGKLLGLAVVLGSSIANSIGVVDMIIWGGVGILTQIVLFFAAELITIRFSIHQAIENNNKAVGLTLLMLSLSVGWVVGQCLTY
jgi:putative membrane protein